MRQLKYTITPTTTTSAAVTFTATCASNINVTGSGAGTLSGNVINWGASGLVAQGGVNCPFTFTNSKATMGTDGQVVVNYSGNGLRHPGQRHRDGQEVKHSAGHTSNPHNQTHEARVLALSA